MTKPPLSCLSPIARARIRLLERAGPQSWLADPGEWGLPEHVWSIILGDDTRIARMVAKVETVQSLISVGVADPLGYVYALDAFMRHRERAGGNPSLGAHAEHIIGAARARARLILGGRPGLLTRETFHAVASALVFHADNTAAAHAIIDQHRPAGFLP